MNIFYKVLNKIDWKTNISKSKKARLNNNLKVLNFEESINYIINSKCSLARYGDNEFTLMLNGEFLCPRNNSLPYQSSDPHLKNRLVNILKDTEIEKYNLKLAVPRTLVDIDQENLTEGSIGFWENYLGELFYKISKFLSKDYLYLNSQISRFYLDDRNKKPSTIENRVSLWKKVWENEDLLIIESKGSGLGKDKTIYQNSKSIQRIECPNSNTYNYYQQIFSAAKELGENKLILLALGPTATVMAYDLAKEGFRALDLGHLELENYFYQTQATAETEINGIKIGQVETIQNDPIPTANQSIKYEMSII